VCYRSGVRLLLIKVEYGFSTLFYSRDLDLDPMTFIYELDSYFLEIYQMSENELHTSRLSKVIV